MKTFTNCTDETAITEITITPDGRIHVFGLSREVLDVLARLCPESPVVADRLQRLAALGTDVQNACAAVTAGSQEPRQAVSAVNTDTAEGLPL